MKTELHPLAIEDLGRQIDYFRDAGVDEAKLKEFRGAVRQARERIDRNPLTWSYAASSRRVRKIQIAQFRMQVFYVVQKGGVPLILEFAGPGLQPRWAGRL